MLDWSADIDAAPIAGTPNHRGQAEKSNLRTCSAASQPSDDKNALQAWLGALLAKAADNRCGWLPISSSGRRHLLCRQGNPRRHATRPGQQGQPGCRSVASTRSTDFRPIALPPAGTRTPPTIVPAGRAAAGQAEQNGLQESSTDAGQNSVAIAVSSAYRGSLAAIAKAIAARVNVYKGPTALPTGTPPIRASLFAALANPAGATSSASASLRYAMADDRRYQRNAPPPSPPPQNWTRSSKQTGDWFVRRSFFGFQI